MKVKKSPGFPGWLPGQGSPVEFEPSRVEPIWLPYLELGSAVAAAGLWYLLPGVGPWPLFLALAPWLLRLVWTGRLRTPTAFDLPLAVFCFTAALAVWSAYDRANAWPQFWLIIGAVFLFSAFVHAEAIGPIREWLLAAFGAVVALYFLATHGWDVYPAKIKALTLLGQALQAPLPALPGHRLHPNVAGGIMAMMLPFAGLVSVRAWRRIRHSDERQPLPTARDWLALAAAGGMLAVTLLGLVMTTSRGATVALSCALLLSGLWWLLGRLDRSRAGWKGWAFLGVLALALAAAAGVMLAWPGGIVEALSSLPALDTGFSRLELVQHTLSLARDYPFVGAGLGGFEMLYSTYALLTHVGYTVHSHNLFLNVAVEQGILALAALVAMWLLFAVAVWRGILHPGAGKAAHPDGEAAALGAAALCLVIVLVHGLVDDVLYGSRGVVLLFVPLAFAVPFLRAKEEWRRRWMWMLAPLALLLTVALALLLRDRVLSLVYSNLGAVHQSQAELAVYRWPEWPLQDDVRRRVNLSRPVAEFERALALNPHNATANRRLGMIELALGWYEEALPHLTAAYEAEPSSPTARQLLGEALIVNGRLEEGRALWAGLRNEQDQLAARHFWYQYIGDSQRADWVQQALSDR